MPISPVISHYFLYLLILIDVRITHNWFFLWLFGFYVHVRCIICTLHFCWIKSRASLRSSYCHFFLHKFFIFYVCWHLRHYLCLTFLLYNFFLFEFPFNFFLCFELWLKVETFIWILSLLSMPDVGRFVSRLSKIIILLNQTNVITSHFWLHGITLSLMLLCIFISAMIWSIKSCVVIALWHSHLICSWNLGC